MILINQHKFKARTISLMHINEMINNTTCSTLCLIWNLQFASLGSKLMVDPTPCRQDKTHLLNGNPKHNIMLNEQ